MYLEKKKLITKRELKNYLGCSLGFIDSLMKKEMIPYYKINRSVKFDMDKVETSLKKLEL
jgi:hypothetical protein